MTRRSSGAGRPMLSTQRPELRRRAGACSALGEPVGQVVAQLLGQGVARSIACACAPARLISASLSAPAGSRSLPCQARMRQPALERRRCPICARCCSSGAGAAPRKPVSASVWRSRGPSACDSRKKSETTPSAGCSKRSTRCTRSVATSSRALGCIAGDYPCRVTRRAPPPEPQDPRRRRAPAAPPAAGLRRARRRRWACSGPTSRRLLSRALIGWNVAVWSYLGWVAARCCCAPTTGHMKRVALAQAESAATVLAIVIARGDRQRGRGRPSSWSPPRRPARATCWSHGVFAALTVARLLAAAADAVRPRLRRRLLPRPSPTAASTFPARRRGFEPDHTDFLYFAFTIAVTAQTSDVAVTTPADAAPGARPVDAVVRRSTPPSWRSRSTSPPASSERGRGAVSASRKRPSRPRTRAAAPRRRRAARRRRSPRARPRRTSGSPADRARAPARARAPRASCSLSPGSTGTTAWRDDRPVVELGGDEVHRRAGHLAAGLDRAPVRVQAGERRQQRRMDVEHAAGVALHEARRRGCA